MAQITSGAFVAINGVDLSLILKNLKINGSADIKDRTALGHTAKHYIKGLVERSVSSETYFKASAVTAEDANGLFQTALTDRDSGYFLLFGNAGAAPGDLAEMLNIKTAKYDIDQVVGELLMAQFEAKATKTATADIYNQGVFIFNQTVITDTNGASYDSGSGGTGYLIQIHVLSTVATGEDGLVTIQHSTNNSTWVDLIVSTTHGENTAVQASSTLTTVNRYVRVVGVPSDASATIVVAIKIGYSG
jgi:hypothetical protein